MTMSATLEADYEACKTIIRTHSTVFYAAFSSLPAEKANALYAVYAFCRTADDCADNECAPLGEADRMRAVNEMRAKFTRMCGGDVPDEALWRALRRTFDIYALDDSAFFEQLDGQESDIAFRGIRDYDELLRYSYRVAGTVGLMLLPILAVKNHAALRDAAVQLGCAMQITNILRDIGEDLKLRARIYIPADLMRAHNYSEADLSAGIIDARFITLWETLASRAEALYERFMPSAALFDDDSRTQVLAAAKAYRAILNAVRDAGYDCFSARRYVNAETLTAIKNDPYGYGEEKKSRGGETPQSHNLWKGTTRP